MKDKDKAKEQFSIPAEMFPHNIETGKSENKCRRAEETLPELENLYQIVFENTGNAIFIIDEDNTILLANEEFEKLTGYARAEVEGKKKWTDLVARKDDLERMKEYHRLRCIDSLSAPRTYEFQLVDRKRQVKDIVVTVTSMPGRRQTLAALLDITDRKRMEAALIESERRLTDIIDFLPDATFAADLSGKVIAWNRAMEEMTGIKAKDMLGKGDHEYTLPFYGIRRPMLIDIALGFAEETEKKYNFINREGNVLLAETDVMLGGIARTLWAKAGPLYDDRGNVTGAIESVRDITERKKMEEAIRRSQKMEAIGTLAGGIAHDFNNILGAILGYSEMAKEELPARHKVIEYINEVLAAVERAKFLVQQILTFSHQSEKQIKPLLVVPMVKEVIKLLGHTLPSTIRIQQNILKKDILIKADTTQIYQILMNLCTNAGHAMHEKGGALTISVNLIEITQDNIQDDKPLPAGLYMELKVADTGRGIDPAVINNIFDPFFTTKKQGEGTGMGLAVVHGIVHDYGGHINVTSKVDEGTAFTIYLPAAQDHIKLLENKAKTMPAHGRERIMIVDDQDYMLKMMYRMLSYLGYTVTAMQNPLEALALFKSDPFAQDMIITDQTMPDLTGADMAREILSFRPDIPIILCTGFSDLVSAAEAKSIGIRKYMMKPISIPDLAQAMRNIFDNKDKQAES